MKRGMKVTIQVTRFARYRKHHQEKKENHKQEFRHFRLSSSNATNQGNHPLVITAVLLLMMVHLLLNLLNQTLLLLVLRPSSRRPRSNAGLLVLMSNNTTVSTDASSISSPNITRSVGASLRWQVGGVGQRAGIGLHTLALDVGVLADLLAAGGGDCVGVDAVVGAFLGGLQGGVGVVGLGWSDRGAAAG
jgi:hypothetical protein